MAIRIIGVLLGLALVGTIGYLLGERSAAPQGVESPQERVFSPDPARSAAPSQPPTPRSVNPPAAAASVPVLPLPPLNTPVATALEDLKKQAAAGNNQAACRLAFELDRCHTVGRVQRGATSFASLAGQPGLGPTS